MSDDFSWDDFDYDEEDDEDYIEEELADRHDTKRNQRSSGQPPKKRGTSRSRYLESDEDYD